MTGQIIQLHGDQHDELRSLLPWYLTGRLDDLERAKVDAHLSECLECQAELRAERRLDNAIAGLPRDDLGAPMDVEHGWALMRRRIQQSPRNQPRLAAWLGGARRDAARQWRASAPWLRWTVAAQFGLLVLLGALMSPTARPARYHALGAAPAVPTGNVVVIFRPDATEGALREALEAGHARFVDGPTAADAYVLHVPAAERAAALATLRRQASIELAEPVDAGGAP